jgi:hypothetical protein
MTCATRFVANPLLVKNAQPNVKTAGLAIAPSPKPS